MQLNLFGAFQKKIVGSKKKETNFTSSPKKKPSPATSPGLTVSQVMSSPVL